MFRTASMLWQTYRLKHREGKTIRSAQEESAYVISALRIFSNISQVWNSDSIGHA